MAKKDVPNLPASSRMLPGAGLGSQIKGALKGKPVQVVAGAVKGAKASTGKGAAKKVMALAKKGGKLK